MSTRGFVAGFSSFVHRSGQRMIAQQRRFLDGMRFLTTRSVGLWLALTGMAVPIGVTQARAAAVGATPAAVCADAGEDTDADGIAGDCDRCLGYDDHQDEDADTVPDGCDLCPGSPDGIDKDADGVSDGCDLCLGHDDQADTDADEIPDGCDLCAGQPDSADADKDRIPDACDRCAGFDDRADADGDSVPDGCDACPASDDRDDTDADAVPDRCDVCPGVDDETRHTVDPLVCNFGNSLSLTSKKALLADVLEALAATLPLRFELPDELAGRTVTVALERTTLEEAVRRILQGTSYTLTYLPPAAASADVQPQRVASITILADAQADSGADTGALPTADAGAGTADGTAASRDVVREARYGRDPATRAGAVRSLGGTPEDPVARNTILLALRDPAAEVRGAALDVVAQFGRYVGIQHIAEIAGSDSEPELRKQALLRLSEIDYPADTASTYIRKALDDPDATVSALARDLLAQTAGQ